MKSFDQNHWAVILGGSSGFGLASAKKLSQHGMNIFIVHRDRKGSMDRIEKEFDSIKQTGVGFMAINTNALTDEGRTQSIDKLKEAMGTNGQVRLVLHSIAYGNLKLIAPSKQESAADVALSCLAHKLGIEKEKLSNHVSTLLQEGCDALHTLLPTQYAQTFIGQEDMEQTIYSMGTSLLSWVQDLFHHRLFSLDARVIGLTSEGNQVAWRGYAAVAAAKVALESISRAIALEFAPWGIRSNIVQPGVTPTAALKLIPGSVQMESVARMRNPFQRTTTPEDVAGVIALLCTDEAAWINGSLIRVDGGEHIASL